MAHERTQPPLSQPSIIPTEYDWPSLFEYDGIPLERQGQGLRASRTTGARGQRLGTWAGKRDITPY
jgi:hypothetical protein